MRYGVVALSLVCCCASHFKTLSPVKHSTCEVFDIGEAGSFQYHACLATAVTTSAIDDHFVILPVFNVFKLHGLNFTKWHECSPDVKLCIFIRFSYVKDVRLLACIQALFQLFCGNCRHKESGFIV